MTNPIPTPEETQYAFFLVRWWKEFFLGLAALLGIMATMRKGRDMEIVVAVSEKQIDQKLLICKQQLKAEILKEFFDALDKRDSHLVEQMRLMIKAEQHD